MGHPGRPRKTEYTKTEEKEFYCREKIIVPGAAHTLRELREKRGNGFTETVAALEVAYSSLRGWELVPANELKERTLRLLSNGFSGEELCSLFPPKNISDKEVTAYINDDVQAIIKDISATSLSPVRTPLYITKEDPIDLLQMKSESKQALIGRHILTIHDFMALADKKWFSVLFAAGMITEEVYTDIIHCIRELKNPIGKYCICDAEVKEEKLKTATYTTLLKYLCINYMPVSLRAKHVFTKRGYYTLYDIWILKQNGNVDEKAFKGVCIAEITHVLYFLFNGMDDLPRLFDKQKASLPESRVYIPEDKAECLEQSILADPVGYKNRLIKKLAESHPALSTEDYSGSVVYGTPEIKHMIRVLALDHIKSSMEGVNRHVLKDLMLTILPEAPVSECIDTLLAENLIYANGEMLIYRYPSILDYLSSEYLEPYRECIDQAVRYMNGGKLDEIASEWNTSVDIVMRSIRRGINAAADRRKTENHPYYFAEDKYKYLYVNYLFDRVEFMAMFGADTLPVYRYLSIRYKPLRKNGKKAALKDALDDPNITGNVRHAVEVYVVGEKTQVGDTVLIQKKTALLNFYIKNYCTEKMKVPEFVAGYNKWVDDNHMTAKKIHITKKSEEQDVYKRIKCFIWGRGRTVRYYDYENRDFTPVIRCVDFKKYANLEISTLVIYRNNPEVMQEFDIRDEYELYTLLSRVWKPEYGKVVFLHRPTIEVGNADRYKQTLNLLIKMAPVHMNDFARRYSELYGVLPQNVIVNYIPPFDSYIHFGMFTFDQKPLPPMQYEKMKCMLTKEFYMVSEVKEIYKKEFPDGDLECINPYSLKALGFVVNKHYIVSNKYPSANAYFRQIVCASPVFCVRDLNIPHIVRAIDMVLSRCKKKLQIVEVGTGVYYTRKKLDELGITKEQMTDFVAAVDALEIKDPFFSVSTIRKNGFHHPLFDLSLPEFFYSSLLTLSKKYNGYIIGNDRLFTKDKYNKIYPAVIRYLLTDARTMTAEKFSDLLNEKFGIKTDVPNARAHLRESGFPYNKKTCSVSID